MDSKRFIIVLMCIQYSLLTKSVVGYHIKLNEAKSTNTRVCVIGAGIAGLTSARYLKDEGVNFTVIEAPKYLGGTWRYDPRVGNDENGLPLHTSMYKNLRANLPKPTMELRGFSTPKDMASYPSQRVYYNYIKSYAYYFNLERYIKFLHLVTSVIRKDTVWLVKYKNVITGEEYQNEYDFVIVGTGHFNKPNMPAFQGEQIFKGTIIHSHDYRVPEKFIDRRVLVVGAGPSGRDIALDISCVCKRIVHSHHSKKNFKTNYPEHYITKPDIKEYNETGVFFTDGTYEDIDDVIYCTGYQFHYPFLDNSSGLNIEKRSVVSLYKYMVNINQPSMMIIGLVIRACMVVPIDAQARYAAALVKGNFTLPSKEDMMAEWQKHADIIYANERPISDIHYLAEKEDQYYSDLSKESGIERVPPVIFKIRSADAKSSSENPHTNRNYVYEIVDRYTFKRSLENHNNLSNYSCKYRN